MENILELQQVSKTFPKSGFRLKDVTFSLPYGAVMGLVGENGAGKTTTIGCILNTIRKDSGTIKLFGREMQDEDTSMRAIILLLIGTQNNFRRLWRGFIEDGILRYSKNIWRISGCRRNGRSGIFPGGCR